MSTTEEPGAWLRDQLERRHLTTHDVAEAAGVRDQAVYYWLTGRTSPKDEAAAKLAELLDVSEIEVRRRFGLWVPEVEPTDAGSDDNPYADPLEAQIWATTELPEAERRQWINLLRERRRATG